MLCACTSGASRRFACSRSRLPPAQNIAPSLVITTLRMSGLFSAALSASTPALDISGPNAFLKSGLLSVRMRVPPTLVLFSALAMSGLLMHQAQSNGTAAPQPRGRAVARVAVDGLHVEKYLQHIGGSIAVTHGQRTQGVAQSQRYGSFQVFRAADALLADVAGNIHNGGHHPLRDKSAAVPDHAHGFAVAGEQGMGCVAHIGAGGRVGGQHAPTAGGVINQHVDTQRSRRVESLSLIHI